MEELIKMKEMPDTNGLLKISSSISPFQIKTLDTVINLDN